MSALIAMLVECMRAQGKPIARLNGRVKLSVLVVLSIKRPLMPADTQIFNASGHDASRIAGSLVPRLKLGPLVSRFAVFVQISHI